MSDDFQNNGSSNPKPPKKRRNEEFNWNRVFKVVLGWSAILFGFFLIMIWSKSGDSGEIEIGFDVGIHVVDHAGMAVLYAGNHLHVERDIVVHA